jgi:hypothetical protein
MGQKGGKESNNKDLDTTLSSESVRSLLKFKVVGFLYEKRPHAVCSYVLALGRAAKAQW